MFSLNGPPSGPALASDGTVVFPVSIYQDPTFVPAVQIRPPGGPLGDTQFMGGQPTVRAGGDGRVVAAWVENGDVRVANLMPGSTSFGPSTPLEPVADTAQAVTLDVDGAGNTIALWWSLDSDGGSGTISRLHANIIPANGGTPFTQQLEQTPAPAGTTLGYQDLGMDVNESGQAIASWLRTSMTSTVINYTLRTAVRPVDSPFDSPQTLDSGNNHFTSPQAGDVNFGNVTAAVNDAGDAAALYFKGTNGSPSVVNYWPGNAEGGFSFPETVLNAASLWSTTTDLALDRDGRAIVAGRGYISGKVRPVVAIRPPGGPFGSQATIVDSGPQSSDNELAAAPNGDVVLLYSVYGTSGEVFATTAERGTSSFGASQPLGTGFDYIQSLYLTIGSTGDGVATWAYQPCACPYVGTATGYDVSPPVLKGFTVPAAATVGTPVAFSVQPVDIWGPVTTSWAFGDDSTGDGPDATHAYGAAGDRTASVTATDAFGHSSSASGPVSVLAPPPVQAGPTPPAPDKTPPAVSAFAASPSTFAVGAKSTPLVAKVRRGTTFKFALSEPGAVAITIARQIPGRLSGKRCVPATRKLRKKKACKAYKSIPGTLKRAGVAGANKVAFTGKLGRRALGVARYRATIVVTDAAGNRSKAATTPFRIVPAR